MIFRSINKCNNYVEDTLFSAAFNFCMKISSPLIIAVVERNLLCIWLPSSFINSQVLQGSQICSDVPRKQKRPVSSQIRLHSSPLMASTLVLFVVFILDLIAFALAVAAEQRRSTARVVQVKEVDSSYCAYDTDIATGLGVGAFLFLMASQVLIMAVSKCFLCSRGLHPSGARSWAVILFITCWVTFVIAEACLLAGSVRNAYHTKYRSVFSDPPSCETLRKGVFGAGAAFVFFTVIASEFYYVCFSKANVQPSYGRDTGVAMGTY